MRSHHDKPKDNIGFESPGRGFLSRRSASICARRSQDSASPDLSLRRLRAVLNFRQKLGLDPNPLVCDPLGVGLRLTDEGLQSFLQVGGRDLVEVMINLACVDQIVAVAATDVSASRCIHRCADFVRTYLDVTTNADLRRG
jgi:hypothetical protein